MNLGADCVCGFRFPSKASFLDASTHKRVRLERVFFNEPISFFSFYKHSDCLNFAFSG